MAEKHVTNEHTIVPLPDIVLPFEAGMHPWHAANEAAITAAWAQEVERRPFLFNGGIVMHFPPYWDGDVLVVPSRMANYACLTHWLKLGGKATRCPEGICHFFGSPVLVSFDGAVIMVLMSQKTANPGQVYAPSGSLDASDVLGGKVDILGNMAREVAEETGLDLKDATPEAGLHLYRNGGIHTCFRRYIFPLTAVEIEKRVQAHLSLEPEPEIEGVVACYNADQRDGRVPDYMWAFLQFHFANNGKFPVE